MYKCRHCGAPTRPNVDGDIRYNPPISAAEIGRLREIEAAAKEWRRSLEGDGWVNHVIEEGAARPGIGALMKLITV